MPTTDAENVDVSSKIKINENGDLVITKDFFNELVNEYSELSAKSELNDGEATTESIFGKKHTYCVTTGDGKKHQFREYSALAHAKCVQLGMKYGTPASMKRGHCD